MNKPGITEQDEYKKQINKVFIGINIIACLILFCVPLTIAKSLTFRDYLRMISVIIPILLIFYINYFIFIDRFLKKRRWGIFLLSNICLSITFSCIYMLFDKFIATTPSIFNEDYPIIVYFARDIFSGTMFTILAVAIKMTIEWQNIEREKVKIEAVASQAELQNLKNQLNPHFLFNTLNNIYSLIAIDKDKAQNAVIGLSKILRYALYDNSQDKVSLEKELSFTRNYIELMSLRLTNKVELRVNLPEHIQDQVIAPLLFITLIENAFKHGVSQSESSFIDIDIEINNSTISCVVKNSFFPKREKDYSGSGIGITNLKRRLTLLYPKKHEYDVSLLDNIYIATLKIQLT